MKKEFDKKENAMYTEEQLEQIAKLAAQTAIQQVLSLPVNLDNRTAENALHSEGEDTMFTAYRETYSYLDESGNTQTIRICGKNKRDTDAKFQKFLCSPKQQTVTLKEFVDNTYRKSFIDGLEETTKANYERYLRLYILPYMGSKPMGEITLATIQSFYDWLANGKSHGCKKNINKKSIDRIGGFLSRILIIATEMKVIQESPFKIKLLRNNGQASYHHKALPDDEVNRIKKAVPLLQDDRERLYMGFLIYTGLRREEILGLEWNHIDFQNHCGNVKQVVVYPNNKKAFIKNNPKTIHSERPFIIPQPLLDILQVVATKTGFIIHGKDPTKPISLSTFQRMYTSVFKKLGIQEYNNHDWRATFGTQLKEAGLTSAQVADIMGHADTRMVETVYAPRRKEGIMKHKKTIETMNESYVCGNNLAMENIV